MTKNEVDLWMDGIMPENRLALTFLHSPFNSPLVLIDASDEATDCVIEDCRQTGSDASDFTLPEPFDGFGLFRVYGEFIPRATFETSDLPRYRLHKIVKLMGDCEMHDILSKPAFFYSTKRGESSRALVRMVSARENHAYLASHRDVPYHITTLDVAAQEVRLAERAFVDASWEEWQ